MTEITGSLIEETKPDRKMHRIVALAVFLISLVQYLTTIAPTTSFWDCGEFIACSYSMSVPHPPGAPFYLLLGRIFSLLVPVADVGLRINFLSVLVTVLTVLFTYLIIVRLVRRFRGEEKTLTDKLVLYGSGVVGALSFSASHSLWFNGVEAEVYAISMFFTAVVVWLAVRWMDESDQSHATKYLLLIAYLVGLATGVHLLNVLALSPIVLLIFFQRWKFSKIDIWSTLLFYTGGTLIVLGVVTSLNWLATLFYLGGFGSIIGAVSLHLNSYFGKHEFAGMKFFLAMAISFVAIGIVYPGVVSNLPQILLSLHNFVSPMMSPDSSEAIELMVLLGLIMLTVAIPTLIAIKFKKHTLSLIFASIFLVILGYTTYSTIYIRSNQKPIINENQPDSIERLISYLNREQYGATGPVETQEVKSGRDKSLRKSGAVFMRLGSDKILRFNTLERKSDFWNYQIFHMYFRYLNWQFLYSDEYGIPKIYFFPMLLGMIGAVGHFYLDRRRAFAVFMLFLMTGLAIVLYLNQENPQPRERDYAYVGSYFAMALWIGIGVATLYQLIIELFKNPSAGTRKSVAIVVAVLTIIVGPVNMLAQNYPTHSRKGNYVAWDYSRNMLESCEEGGILFTNGDNDTFPLWYLQVVEGVRPDVRVVNLSLLNTDWYIKQLRDEEPRVPVELTDDDIEVGITGYTREALAQRYMPEGSKRVTIPGRDGEKMSWNLPATMYLPVGAQDEQPGKPNFLRVQDVMIAHIMMANKWNRPIYFAVTVSQTNLIGLHDYLSMEGLTFKLHSEKVPEVDEAKLRDNMFNVYDSNYRNLNNPDVFYFQNIIKLIQNYRSGFLQLVYEYYQEWARNPMAMSSGIPEEQWEGRFDELVPAEKALFTLRRMEERIPGEVIPLYNQDVLLQIGRIYCELGDKEAGGEKFDQLYEMDKRNFDKVIQAAFFHIQYAKNKERAVEILSEIENSNKANAEQLFQIAAVYDRSLMKEDLNRVLDKINNIPSLGLRDKTDLAAYYITAGELERAKNMLETLSVDNPDNGAVMGGLIEVYKELKDTPRVVDLLTEWVAKNPQDNRAKAMLENWSAQ